MDGVPGEPNGFVKLADTPVLTDWEVGGSGAMGVYQRNADGGTVFNGGTTDWARVLADVNAQSHVIVDQITRNVMRRFIGLPPHAVSREDTVLIDVTKPLAGSEAPTPSKAAV